MTSILSSFAPFFSTGISNVSQVAGNQQLPDQVTNQQNQNSTNNSFGAAFSLNISDAGLNALSSGSSACSGNSATDTLSAVAYSGSSSNSVQGGTSSFEALLISLTGSDSGQNTDSASAADSSVSGNGSADAVGGIDQLLNYIEQALVNTENSLENIGTGSTAQASSTAPASTSVTDPNAADSTAFAEAALVNSGPLPTFLAQVDTQMHLNDTQKQALQNIATQYQNADNTPDTVQSIAGALQQAGI